MKKGKSRRKVKNKEEEMLVICSECGGIGTVYDEEKERIVFCPVCKGEGKYPLWNDSAEEEEKKKVAKRNRRRAKRVEKRVSELFEGLRIGILGGADVLTDKFAVEVKSRKKIAVLQWWEQAVKNAEKLKKEPLLVVHEYGKKKYFVVIELEQFKRLIGSCRE